MLTFSQFYDAKSWLYRYAKGDCCIILDDMRCEFQHCNPSIGLFEHRLFEVFK